MWQQQACARAILIVELNQTTWAACVCSIVAADCWLLLDPKKFLGHDKLSRWFVWVSEGVGQESGVATYVWLGIKIRQLTNIVTIPLSSYRFSHV